jgi:GT2 family glycosyltransferase
MRPQVDFAVVSLNRIDSVIIAINSALAQEGIDGRVYVIDQHSDPKAFTKLEQYCAGRERVTLVRNLHNTGVGAGRNQAIAMSLAPFVMGIDDDASLIDEQQALRAFKAIEGDPAIGVLAFHLVDTITRETPETILNIAAQASAGLPLSAFQGAGFLLRRSAFEAAGGFDERLFFYHEEGDLCRRMINLGFKVAYAPDVTMLHPFFPGRGPHDSPRRWFFHVRNSIYLAAKYNLSSLGTPLMLARIVKEGMRRRLYWPTLHGFASGLGMVPRGLALRFGDARVRLSAEARRTLRAGSPTRDMSLAQRLAFRAGLKIGRG